MQTIICNVISIKNVHQLEGYDGKKWSSKNILVQLKHSCTKISLIFETVVQFVNYNKINVKFIYLYS